MSDLFVKSNNTSDDFKISTLTFEYVNNADNVQQGGNISDPSLTELFDNEFKQNGGFFGFNLFGNNAQESVDTNVTSEAVPNIETLNLSDTSELNSSSSESQIGGNADEVNVYSVSELSEVMLKIL